MLEALIEREGGYVDHCADRGGATRYGITKAVARAQGYQGAMAALPRDKALAIHRRLYWLRPRYDQLAARSPRIAANCSTPAVATNFLQRALTALNRNGKDFADLVADRRVGRIRWRRSTPFSRRAGGAAARPSLCARSKRCRASATSVSPSGARSMRHSFTAG